MKSSYSSTRACFNRGFDLLILILLLHTAHIGACQVLTKDQNKNYIKGLGDREKNAVVENADKVIRSVLKINVNDPDSINFTPDLKVESNFDSIINGNSIGVSVRKDLQFIVLGDASTTSGFSLDLSNKLSAKITGSPSLDFTKSKRGFLTLEIEAAQKNSDISIFSNGRFAGQIVGNISWHSFLNPAYSDFILPKRKIEIYRRVFNAARYNLNDGLIDTVRVLAFFTGYNLGEKVYQDLTNTSYHSITITDTKLQKHYNDSKTFASVQYLKDPITFIPKLVDSLGIKIIINSPGDRKLAIILFKKYFPEITIDTSFTSEALIYCLKDAVDLRGQAKLIEDYKKCLVRLSNRYESIVTEEVKQASSYILSKHIRWLTYSFSTTYQGYKMYGKDNEGTTLSGKSMIFFAPNFSVWLSKYDIYLDQGNLWRYGVELVYGNNFKDFKAVKYYEKDTLQIEPNGNVVIAEQTTEGLYRNEKSRQQYKLYVNAYAEYYFFPRKKFAPGYSFKLGYLKEGILPGNIRKFRPEIGLVLNLLNKEKDKSLISIQPYLRYDNIFKQVVAKNDNVNHTLSPKEKLVVGILVGLPIKGKLTTGN